MYITVNGTKLFFDVDGEKLAVDGESMREKPTLILLHGGPGFDHSTYKPLFSQLSDIVQIIYLDHRGNGRSDRGSTDHWHLEQWADDLKIFCDTLGIEKPIIFGNSFGGMVAIAYAIRYLDHPSKLVFSSTFAKINLPRMISRFTEFGGVEAGKATEKFWTNPNSETFSEYSDKCLSIYNTVPALQEAGKRAILNYDIMNHFIGKEAHEFDFIDDLKNITCPTLVMGGEIDPVCPIEDHEDIAASIPKEHLQFERFENCGHGVFRDSPEKSMAILREFILS